MFYVASLNQNIKTCGGFFTVSSGWLQEQQYQGFVSLGGRVGLGANLEGVMFEFRHH